MYSSFNEPAKIEKQKHQDLYKELKKLEKLIIENYENNKNWSSSNLNQKIKDLHVRFNEPMRIAIVGQFSSGKSTFLNALLSKNILPTGVRPVTSKINYIKYGEQIRFEAIYDNGRRESYDINAIKMFTDSRNENNLDDLDYLVLYYPLDLLKEIVFVDTPGLNSTSEDDTRETTKVLNSVDGIIWLTFARNAAQKSEIDIIEEIMTKYKEKSLCIVNKKDQLEKDELQQVLDEVHKLLGGHFKKIEAISAKQALESRGTTAQTLAMDKLDKYIHEIEKELKSKILKDDFSIESLLTSKSTQLQKQLEKVSTTNKPKNNQLLKESNIEVVLNFIQTDIKNQQISSKHFALKNGLKTVANNLIKENNLFIESLKDLDITVHNYHIYMEKSLNDFFDKELKRTNNSMIDAIGGIIDESLNAIMFAWIEFENVKIVDSWFRDNIPYKSAYIEYEKVGKYIEKETFKTKIDEFNNLLEKTLKKIEVHFDKIEKNLEQHIEDWGNRSLKIVDSSHDYYSNSYFLNFQNKYISNKFERITNKLENYIIESKNSIKSEFKVNTHNFTNNTYTNTYSTIGLYNSIIRDNEFAYEKLEKPIPFVLPKKSEIKKSLYSMYIYEYYEQYIFSNKEGIFAKKIASIISDNNSTVQDMTKDIKNDIKAYENKNKKLDNFIKSLV